MSPELLRVIEYLVQSDTLGCSSCGQTKLVDKALGKDYLIAVTVAD